MNLPILFYNFYYLFYYSNINFYRFSVTSKIEVTMAEVKDFEQKWRTVVMKMNKFTGNILLDRNEVHKMSPLLNTICEKLWIRDQEYLLKNGLTI